MSSLLIRSKYQRTYTLFHCLLAHVLGLLLTKNIRKRIWTFYFSINFLDLILKNIFKQCDIYSNLALIVSIFSYFSNLQKALVYGQKMNKGNVELVIFKSVLESHILDVILTLCADSYGSKVSLINQLCAQLLKIVKYHRCIDYMLRYLR